RAADLTCGRPAVDARPSPAGQPQPYSGPRARLRPASSRIPATPSTLSPRPVRRPPDRISRHVFGPFGLDRIPPPRSPTPHFPRQRDFLNGKNHRTAAALGAGTHDPFGAPKAQMPNASRLRLVHSRPAEAGVLRPSLFGRLQKTADASKGNGPWGGTRGCT